MRADLAQARAGVARALGAGAPVRRRFSRRALREEAPAVRAARRPALPDRRHPLRHRAQQGAQGHRRALAAADGPARGVSPRLGLPRPADRAAGREGAGQGRKASSTPAEFRERCQRARAEVRRRHARRVQAARLPRHLGRSLPDAVQGLRGDDRAPAGGVRAPRAHLPRQEAGALVPGAQHRARRGRGRVRGAHLALDLRALSARGRPGRRPCPSSRASRPRSSSGPRRPGRCRRTWRSSPTPSSATSRCR